MKKVKNKSKKISSDKLVEILITSAYALAIALIVEDAISKTTKNPIKKFILRRKFSKILIEELNKQFKRIKRGG